MAPHPLALALALLAAAPAAGEGPGPPEIREGLPAPAFSLRTMNPEGSGEAWVALDRFVGEDPDDPAARLVVLSFFASWCEPCRRELPFLVRLDREYRDLGLRVLGVDVDQDDAGIAAARQMVAAAGVAYPVLSDRLNFLARRYLGEPAPLPSVFLVRRDGVIARVARGYAGDDTPGLLADVRVALGVAPAARPPPEPAKAR